jgi:nucleoside-diphosphate-sugar epimerase
VARILIVGGGCRGRRLASALVGEGHAVRITTRAETGRAAIEQAGAECWVGTPARLATLRGALESVAVVCWLLGTAAGAPTELLALHSDRLEFFLGQAIDTTVRGFVYEGAGGTVAPEILAAGERIVQTAGQRNSIPVGFLRAGIGELDAWQAEARATVGKLLGEELG